MQIAIQINILNGWENNPPVLHTVINHQQAFNMAHAMSKQFGNVSVRLTYPEARYIAEKCPNHRTLNDYISSLSGSYIQYTGVEYGSNSESVHEYCEILGTVVTR